jgi:hypothetical protein
MKINTLAAILVLTLLVAGVSAAIDWAVPLGVTTEQSASGATVDGNSAHSDSGHQLATKNGNQPRRPTASAGLADDPSGDFMSISAWRDNDAIGNRDSAFSLDATDGNPVVERNHLGPDLSDAFGNDEYLDSPIGGHATIAQILTSAEK